MKEKVSDKSKFIKYIKFGIVGWLLFSACFFFIDKKAFWVSLILPPILGAMLYVPIRKGYLILSLFFLLTFIAHAIGPPFFFMRRGLYYYSGGYGAIMGFRFGILEFLGIYIYLFVLLFVILCTTLFLNHHTLGKRRFVWPNPRDLLKAGISGIRQIRPGQRGQNLTYSILMLLFIFFLAIPINIFMYNHRVGLLGLRNDPLPFRLTGILSYSRLFLFPLIISFLYMKTRPAAWKALLVLGYSFIAGIASTSRTVLFFSSAPVLLFYWLGKKYGRLLLSALFVLIVFGWVSSSREFTILNPWATFVDTVPSLITESEISPASLFENIGGIANRLYGPQDIVLAYQYELDDQINAINKYFLLQTVIRNLSLEIFGLLLPADSGFGVGLGLLAWLILLANENYVFLILLGMVIAIFLNLCEFIIRRYLLLKSPLNLLAYPIGFFLTTFLYSSTLNWFYQLLILAGGFVFYILRFHTKHRML